MAKGVINWFQIIAVEIIGTLSSDSNCQKDIDALGAASATVPGAKPINDDSLMGAISGMDVENGVTATAAASTLNDPSINSYPNVANGPLSNYFKITPNNSITQSLAQLGGNTVYFRPAYVIGLSVNAGADF